MSGLAHETTHAPSFAMLRVDLRPGEALVAEAGAMVARSRAVEMEVKLNAASHAGLWAFLKALLVALIRKFVGGETLIVNRFSTQAGGSVWLAPPMAGEVSYRRLEGQGIVLSQGAYLAHSGDLDIRMRFGGLRSLLAKEGLFFLEISGQGELWFTSYGGIQAVEVTRPFTVDNGHLVGYEGALDFDIRSVGGGVLGFFASGEGLVCEFRGQGKVYLQSRNIDATVGWLTPLLP